MKIVVSVNVSLEHSSHCKFGAYQKCEPDGWKGNFGKFVKGFDKSRPQLFVLNIDWVQVVVGLYDKQASDVLYKKYIRLIYTPPDLLARFCKVNLLKAKNSAWFVFQEFFFQAQFTVIKSHYGSWMWSKMIAIF